MMNYKKVMTYIFTVLFTLSQTMHTSHARQQIGIIQIENFSKNAEIEYNLENNLIQIVPTIPFTSSNVGLRVGFLGFKTHIGRGKIHYYNENIYMLVKGNKDVMSFNIINLMCSGNTLIGYTEATRLLAFRRVQFKSDSKVRLNLHVTANSLRNNHKWLFEISDDKKALSALYSNEAKDANYLCSNEYKSKMQPYNIKNKKFNRRHESIIAKVDWDETEPEVELEIIQDELTYRDIRVLAKLAEIDRLRSKPIDINSNNQKKVNLLLNQLEKIHMDLVESENRLRNLNTEFTQIRSDYWTNNREQIAKFFNASESAIQINLAGFSLGSAARSAKASLYALAEGVQIEQHENTFTHIEKEIKTELKNASFLISRFKKYKKALENL